MLQKNHAGQMPRIATSAYVHPSAVLIGNLDIGERVFIGPNAVIRSDEPGPDGKVRAIVIEMEANIQDGVIIHALGGTGVKIGRGSSLAHAAVIHGPCEIGAGCFVGFNSVVFNASIDDGSVVMHQALVQDTSIPKGVLVPSMTAICDAEAARRLMPVTDKQSGFAANVRKTNLFLTEVSQSNLEKQQIQITVSMDANWNSGGILTNRSCD